METSCLPPLSVGYFNSSIAHPGMRETQPHIIPNYQLEVSIEAGGITYLDEEAIEVVAHSIFCAKPGQIRHTKLPFRCYYIQIEPGEGELFSALDALPSHWTATPAQTREYVRRIQQLCSLQTKQDRPSRLRFLSILFRFLAELCEEQQTLQRCNRYENERNRVAIDSAVTYMKHHLSEKCTLETIAESVNFSPIYFHKLFTQAMGKTPYAYLLQLRIDLAQKLLATTDTSLCEIAFACGFHSQSYFQHIFAKEMGITPTTYRKEQQSPYSI